MGRWRSERRLAATLGAGVLLTLAAPPLGFGVVRPSHALAVTAETGIVLTATFATVLMLDRLRLDRRVADGLLAMGLGMLAFSGGLSWWVLAFEPHLSTGARIGELAVARLLTAALFLLAGCAPPRWLDAGSRLLVGAGLVCLAFVGAMVGRLVLAVGDVGGRGTAATAEGVGAGVLQAEAVGAVAFGLAAFGLARAGRRSGDLVYSYLAFAAVATSLARLNFLLEPSLYLGHLYLGDLFRLAAFAVIGVGFVHETRRALEIRASESLRAERRRVARQIHDGLAHEAAFIATAARQVARSDPSPQILEIGEAAERALDETRRVIHLYSGPVHEPLDRLLVHIAEQVAQRGGARVRADCDGTIHSDADVAEALCRIVRESVTNAVRHGRADLIELDLHRNGRLRLTVTDNGQGFDASSVAGGGFGLTSMRERAEALGGTLEVGSAPGLGTKVEVVL